MKKLILTAIIALTAPFAMADEQAGIQTNLDLEKGYVDLAHTMAKSFNEHGPCGYAEVYTMDIVNTVRKARNYFDNNWDYNKQANRKFKISQETKNAIKTTLALKDIMNMLDHKRPETYAHAFNRVVMWGPAPGVYGNMNYWTFHKDGKATYSELELLNEDPYFKWNHFSGEFKVTREDKGIFVYLTAKGVTTKYKLQQHIKSDWFNRMWNLVPADEPNANPWLEGFVDYPSECEA